MKIIKRRPWHQHHWERQDSSVKWKKGKRALRLQCRLCGEVTRIESRVRGSDEGEPLEAA